MIPYVFAACGLYGLDRVILRSIKTRFTKATIRALPELNATHIQIPGINAGWRAGQHVRVQVLSKSMGWVGCFEVHPFTVASVSESEEGMVLICQDVGDWTRKLYNLASAGIAAAEKGGEVGREVRLMVEGPYGECSLNLLSIIAMLTFFAQEDSGVLWSAATLPLFSSLAEVALRSRCLQLNIFSIVRSKVRTKSKCCMSSGSSKIPVCYSLSKMMIQLIQKVPFQRPFAL